MLRWVSRILIVSLIGYIGLLLYEYNRLGIFSMPDLPHGAYYVSFDSGLRGIVLNADVPETSTGSGPKFLRSLSVENRDIRYIGISQNVPSWFANAWSVCEAPTEQERDSIMESLPNDTLHELGNARFEAVCQIDADGESLLRGVLFSVPRL